LGAWTYSLRAALNVLNTINSATQCSVRCAVKALIHGGR
jgi:hypothetical protein